jgi:nucleotide-binding universal stress UspA family protein
MPGVYSPSGSYLPKAMKEIEDRASESLKAIAENVDLIVIATHGQSGWKKFWTGSVTEWVVRLADRSVLTIHSKE